MLVFLFFFYCYDDLRLLHSFPTRRSSDLFESRPLRISHITGPYLLAGWSTDWGERLPVGGKERSEEHTSELQSRRDLVCRLLLEKKKKKLSNIHATIHRKLTRSHSIVSPD